MMLITLEQAKAQIVVGGDLDDDLITAKIAAAQTYLETHLGYSIADRYEDAPPAALVEAALQLVAHWYESREAAGDAMRAAPFGVSEIIDAYRDWSF